MRALGCLNVSVALAGLLLIGVAVWILVPLVALAWNDHQPQIWSLILAPIFVVLFGSGGFWLLRWAWRLRRETRDYWD